MVQIIAVVINMIIIIVTHDGVRLEMDIYFQLVIMNKEIA
jgi:hypothetical protein